MHAASPHIMDMYGGTPPAFHLNGMKNTPRHAEHRVDLWNYFYRGIITFALAGKAFGIESLFQSVREFADTFAREGGHDYGDESTEA